jgi:hydrogenase maturation protease
MTSLVAPLVVGIGNRSRGDDAVGPEVAAMVARGDLPGIEVVVESDPLELIEHLAGRDTVVVVDALRPSGSAGRVRVLVVDDQTLPRGAAAVGSHGFGVLDAVELARSLGKLPARMTLVGIEAETFETGAPLSVPVRAQLALAARAVVGALART